MKFSTLRILAAFSLATLLAACGGAPADQLAEDAASVQASVITTGTAVVSAGADTNATSSASISGTNAGNGVPLPDCAAEGCSSPRIIDGNAEAFRYAAMQRSAGDTPQS